MSPGIVRRPAASTTRETVRNGNGQIERFVADPENPTAADEQMADTERLRRVEVRVANQDERHGRVACGSLAGTVK